MAMNRPTADRANPDKVLPVTKGYPIVGSLPGLLADPFRFLDQARSVYGDIYRLDLGFTKVIVLGHPRHAQHVFIDQAAKYTRGGVFWDTLRSIFGNGLITSEGQFWLRQRRMMQPHFHRRRLAGLTSSLVRAIEESLSTWPRQLASDPPFDLAPACNELTMRLTMRALFGETLSLETAAEVSGALSYVLDYILRAFVTKSLPSMIPVPGRKKYERAIAKIDENMLAIIDSCRRQNEPADHLLAMLIDAVDDETNDRMTNQQLRDEVTTLFVAGFETTAVSLSWTFECLARRQDIQRRLHAEVDEVLGDRPPTFDDLPRLPYARRVLQEAMRLYPPAWQLPRIAVRDDVIDGYPIPAGTTVVCLIYAYHRHPGEWPNPEVFDPERFNPDCSDNRHNFAYMPFGAGQRLCLGRDLVLLEGPLAIAMIAQRFCVHPASRRPVPSMTSTLRPKGGVLVRLVDRAGDRAVQPIAAAEA